MFKQRFQVSAFVILGLLLHAGMVSAEQSCPDGETPERMREIAAEAFAEGQRLYDEGNHRAALERFQCSFQLVPHPNTLFNIGETAELAGDAELALRTFQRYLASYPEGQARDQAEERVRALGGQAGEARPEDSGNEPVAEPQEQPQGDEEIPDWDPEPSTGEMRMSTARRAAWGTFAAGLALGIAGGALYGVAVSRNGDYQQNRDDFDDGLSVGWTRDDFDAEAASGEAFESAGWALMGVGLASLATSIILFAAFDGEVPVEGQAYVAPFAGEGLAGVSVGGSF